MKAKKNNSEYDIRKIYEQMELDLISSMKRNLSRHEKEQEKMGFKFEQWQSAKLRNLEKYRNENKAIITKYENKINNSITLNLINTYRRAQDTVNRFIKKLKSKYIEDVFVSLPGDLQPIIKTAEPGGEQLGQTLVRVLENAKAWQEAPTPIDDTFFKSNDNKFNALLETVDNDFKNANAAVLRRMDDVYRQTLFKAQVYYNQGTVGLDKAVDTATKDFLEKGIDAITYKNGSKVNISSYAEMALRTANHRAYLMGEGKKRQEMGLSLVFVSAHATSCKLCLPWQGKIVIDDVYSGGKPEDGPYPLLSEAMKQGLMHPNCRHDLSTYFPGITSLPTITDKKQVLRNYEREQRQRALERQIRAQKRKVAGTVDSENLKAEKKKLGELQEEMRNYLKENPQLRRAYKREKPDPGVSNKDLKVHEKQLQGKATDDKIKEIREYIKSDECNKKLYSPDYVKHIEGTNEYKTYKKSYSDKKQYGPSKIIISEEEAQELIYKFSGSGEIGLNKKGDWDNRETIFSNDMIVGKAVNNLTGKEAETTVFKIHYSSKGAHMVPDYPSKKKDR